mgnify:CR=1 FL=1
MIEKEQLIRELTTITREVLAKAQLKAGDIFVLGCSTSEIAGGVIGKNSSHELAVVPQLHAGGACSVAAFRYFNEPVEVEHLVAKAGIDLGDTSIGMHIKHVQVPIRPSIRELGGAHVTALYSRPKYIGGPRAKYE